jgi:hypothetical protein
MPHEPHLTAGDPEGVGTDTYTLGPFYSGGGSNFGSHVQVRERPPPSIPLHLASGKSRWELRRAVDIRGVADLLRRGHRQSPASPRDVYISHRAIGKSWRELLRAADVRGWQICFAVGTGSRRRVCPTSTCHVRPGDSRGDRTSDVRRGPGDAHRQIRSSRRLPPAALTRRLLQRVGELGVPF